MILCHYQFSCQPTVFLVEAVSSITQCDMLVADLLPRYTTDEWTYLGHPDRRSDYLC